MSSVQDPNFEVFISLRFGEAMEQAKAIKRGLEARGISTFLCDVDPGGDIAKAVIHALHHCTMAVILGTGTYGTETDCGFSTFQELRYIYEKNKSFFLVKMCSEFEVPETAFRLTSNVSYLPWMPKGDGDTDAPAGLIDGIVNKLKSVRTGQGKPALPASASAASGHCAAQQDDNTHILTPELKAMLDSARVPSTQVRMVADAGYAFVEDLEDVTAEELVEDGLKKPVAKRVVKEVAAVLTKQKQKQSHQQPQQQPREAPLQTPKQPQQPKEQKQHGVAVSAAMDSEEGAQHSTVGSKEKMEAYLAKSQCKDEAKAKIRGIFEEKETGFVGLSNNSIGDDGARALAEAMKGNTTLTDLHLGNNSIGADGARALAEVLKGNTTLTYLGLGNNSIGDDGARALAEALKGNTTLTELDLGNNSIGDDGARALAEALKGNTTLTELELWTKCIGADGARALAEALKGNTTLTELDLYGNSIGDDGARALAEALRGNATLTKLKLYGNSIGDDGARALAEALKGNTTLTYLGLDGNSIGDDGARALAEALKGNATLTDLKLQSNNIGADGARALAEALKGNATLTDLNLSLNKIGDDGARALAEALKDNTALTNFSLWNGLSEDVKELLHKNKSAALRYLSL